MAVLIKGNCYFYETTMYGCLKKCYFDKSAMHGCLKGMSYFNKTAKYNFLRGKNYFNESMYGYHEESSIILMGQQCTFLFRGSVHYSNESPMHGCLEGKWYFDGSAQHGCLKGK